MRMTSKGQVTIPKAVREKLGVGPGDKISFREEGGHVIISGEQKEPRVDAGESLVDGLRELGRRAKAEGWFDPYWADKSTDEIMEELRGYSEDANDPGFKRSA